MIKRDDPVDNENLQFKNLMSQNEKNLDTVKEAFAKSEYETQSSTRYFTSREVKIIVFSFGLRILCTGGLWDHYVHKYHDLLMVLSTNPTIRHQQEQEFKSVSMWLIMWFWRIVSACGMLEHLVYATFFDKLWVRVDLQFSAQRLKCFLLNLKFSKIILQNTLVPNLGFPNLIFYFHFRTIWCSQLILAGASCVSWQ